VKLASNENPLGPSPLALEEMKHHLEDLHRYPTAGWTSAKSLPDGSG
jgi:histidinol-phosphate aminotransferase